MEGLPVPIPEDPPGFRLLKHILPPDPPTVILQNHHQFLTLLGNGEFQEPLRAFPHPPSFLRHFQSMIHRIADEVGQGFAQKFCNTLIRLYLAPLKHQTALFSPPPAEIPHQPGQPPPRLHQGNQPQFTQDLLHPPHRLLYL